MLRHYKGVGRLVKAWDAGKAPASEGGRYINRRLSEDPASEFLNANDLTFVSVGGFGVDFSRCGG